MDILSAMFSLVSTGLFGDELSDEVISLIKDEEKMTALYKISNHHDIAHLVGYGLEKNILLDPSTNAGAAFAQAQFVAVYRYENIKHELDKILSLFDRESVECIVLKGSVIRKYYSEPWLRTSCDIDILIHDEDSQRAIALLENELKYKYDGKNGYDYQIYAPNGVHLELHFGLIEEDQVLKADKVLDAVWENTVCMDGYKSVFEMNDNMFYYYHIIHMAKHLLAGGCGIKPFIDIIILNQNVKYGQSAYDLLKSGSLDLFEKCAYRLARVWFLGEKADEISDRLADYVLHGGVYGNTENRIAATKEQHGGTIGYYFYRIFIPYKFLVLRYPSLKNHKWLMPFYQVRRWYDLLFKGRAAYSFNELKTNQTISSDKVKRTNIMIDELGLK